MFPTPPSFWGPKALKGPYKALKALYNRKPAKRTGTEGTEPREPEPPGTAAADETREPKPPRTAANNEPREPIFTKNRLQEPTRTAVDTLLK